MDPSSRNVLKRKEFMLGEYLQWNDEFTNALKQETILSDDNVAKIRRQKENNGKTSVLLERISSKGRPNEPLLIADVLDQTRHSFTPDWYNSWLADELRAEMQVEQEQLVISEELSAENATIVHREFGHKKRLAELEKKVLIGMLSMRTQMTKNIWQQRCITNAQDAQNERIALEERELHASAMGDNTASYFDENNHRVKLPANQKLLKHQTSRAALMATPEPEHDEDVLKRLDKNIDNIQRILGASLLAAETLDKERVRVLKAMGLSTEEIAKVLLDEEIRRALEENLRQIAEAEARIVNRAEECEHLQQEIAQFKLDHAKQMRNKEKNIQILELEVKRASDRQYGMSQELKDLLREVHIAKLELEEWKDWYRSIEHSKRLHDIYQRDLPKLKAKGIPALTASTEAHGDKGSETALETPPLDLGPEGKPRKPSKRQLTRTQSRNWMSTHLPPVQHSSRSETGEKRAPFRF